MGLQLRLWAIVAVIALVGGCTTPPQQIDFEETDEGWQVTAKWDSLQITIVGLENALEEAMDKLAEAQQGGNQAHANQWQQIIDKILALKGDAIEAPETPGAAALVRPTRPEAAAAYAYYEDEFEDLVYDALAVGISELDLQDVKTALLN